MVERITNQLPGFLKIRGTRLPNLGCVCFRSRNSVSTRARSWKVWFRGRVDLVALWGAQGLGGRRPWVTSAAWAKAEPEFTARAAAPPSGTASGGPSLLSPGEAGPARRAASTPGAQSSRGGRRRGPRAHRARPQARVPPLSYTRSHTPDAGSRGVSGTLPRAFAPPLGTDAASGWPRSAPQGEAPGRGPPPGTGRG